MASIKEIVQLEGERIEPSQYSVVHLFHEGSFLRAYEWSAWLLCRYMHKFFLPVIVFVVKLQTPPLPRLCPTVTSFPNRSLLAIALKGGEWLPPEASRMALPSLPLELCALATEGTQEGEGQGWGLYYYSFSFDGLNSLLHSEVSSTLYSTNILE